MDDTKKTDLESRIREQEAFLKLPSTQFLLLEIDTERNAHLNRALNIVPQDLAGLVRHFEDLGAYRALSRIRELPTAALNTLQNELKEL